MSKEKGKKLTPAQVLLGSIFALLFVLTSIYLQTDVKIPALEFLSDEVLQVISIAEIAVALFFFIPHKKGVALSAQVPKSERSLSKRTLWASLLILVLVPFTIFFGMYFLDDRKFYFISIAIILETIVPFCIAFESRKPQARELIVISVLSAIAVAGRMALFMVPFLKPVIALTVIAGVCLGGETGFLVGAISAFVSNFFFGQGPWTPWQMFSFGIIGFFAGILFRKGVLRKTKVSLSVFGFIATLVLYGGIMNPASVILWQDKVTWEMILSSYVMGVPFDMIHALSTAFFIWFMAEPMADKLGRIKAKYGLSEG